jgi:hypothetical protein
MITKNILTCALRQCFGTDLREYMRSMPCNMNFRNQLRTRTETEENRGKSGSSGSVAEAYRWSLTSSWFSCI